MDYTLAKELKVAGFPQHDPLGKTCFGDCHSAADVHFPTLGELIEACGENFIGVAKQEDSWLAWSKGDTPEKAKRASTAVEAVSRLWLASNKK